MREGLIPNEFLLGKLATDGAPFLLGEEMLR